MKKQSLKKGGSKSTKKSIKSPIKVELTKSDSVTFIIKSKGNNFTPDQIIKINETIKKSLK